MRTYLSCAMALLFLPLFTEPVAAQSSDSSQLRCDSAVIYNVNDIIVGKIINVYDQRGNILSETTYSGDNITKRVEYTYSGQGYKTTTYKRRKGELTRTEESEYNNLGQEVVKIEYPEIIYSGDGEAGENNKTVFTYFPDGIMSSKTLYVQYVYDDPEYWYLLEHYEYDRDGNIILEAWDYHSPEYDDNGNLVYLARAEYTYDALGNMLSMFSYCPECRIVNAADEWTYDSHGRVSTHLYTVGIVDHSHCHRDPWSGPVSDDYYSRIVVKEVYEYDSENNLVQVAEYTSSDNPIEIPEDYYYGWWQDASVSFKGTWDVGEVVLNKHEKDYDSMGNKVWDAEYVWCYILNGENYLRSGDIHVYDYDDYDRLTGESYYTYNISESRWVGEYNHEYIYDENGHRLSTIYYKEAYITSRSVSNHNHQDSNYQWVYDTKTDYTYDEEGNVIKTTSYSWSNNQWNEGNHTIYYYTADTPTIETITKAPLLVSPRKVFKDGKLQIEINGQCYGIAGERL